MRVLVTCDFLLKYAAAQAAALAGAGEDVALLCRTHAAEFGGDEGERRALLVELKRGGVKVFEMSGRFRSVAALPSMVRTRRMIKEWKPDVVHVHDNYDPRLLLLTRGFPHVLTIHDPSPHLGASELFGLRARFRREWFKRARNIVVHGERLRESLIAAKETSVPVIVIPLGVSSWTSPLPVPDQPRVLFFGRLEPYKGLRVLIAAMDIVWRTCPKVKLVIAGWGSEAHLVPDVPRIEFRNEYVPEEQLEELFAAASIAVLPYVDASQSAAGLETLRRGIPTIVTDVGSLPEIVDDAALVVPPDEPAALARTILMHLDHDDVLRRRVLEYTRLRSSWEAVASEHVALYSRLLVESGALPGAPKAVESRRELA